MGMFFKRNFCDTDLMVVSQSMNWRGFNMIKDWNIKLPIWINISRDSNLA